MTSTTIICRESPKPVRVKYLQHIVAVICLLLYLPAGWAVPPESEGEIAQLLNRISSSDCELQRNGSSYTPAEARAHIERKYKHTRRYIKTSEDFIKYTATDVFQQ